MKAVDFNKLQVGDLIQVPRTQFAPMRRGWNGWLFSEAVVIRKGIGRKSKKNVVTVEMMIPTERNNYKTAMGQHGDTYVGQRIEARDIDVVGHINTRDKAQALELRRRMLAIGDNMFRYDAASGVNSLEVSIFYSKEFLGV